MNIRGVELRLHPNELLSNHIRDTGDFFEAEILDYISLHHPVHRSILDIGANIGNHAVYFAKYLKYGAIFCFEPIQENFELLIENTAPFERILATNAAVSASSSSEFRMIVDSVNMGASHASLDGERLVKSISIDRLALNHVTLMKIDVEGHEPAVITGATDTIIRCHPLILIEDWEKKYGELLKPFDYELEKGWDKHKTYLYRWIYA